MAPDDGAGAGAARRAVVVAQAANVVAIWRGDKLVYSQTQDPHRKSLYWWPFYTDVTISISITEYRHHLVRRRTRRGGQILLLSPPPLVTTTSRVCRRSSIVSSGMKWYGILCCGMVY